MPNTHKVPSKETSDSQAIDFRVLYYTLRERLWVVALTLLIAACGTTAYLLRAPKIYGANVVLQVEQGDSAALSQEGQQFGGVGAAEAVVVVARV